VLTETAVEFGVCIRPIPLRRVDVDTGETEVIDVLCGSTPAAACPLCAARARKLLTDPDVCPDPATAEQRGIVSD
jgi:hypothetical protein